MNGTTVVCVRKNGSVAMAGDGQVTLGNTIVKRGAVKIRRLYDNKVLCGFAGSVADAITLFEKFEGYISKANGDIARASVELAKEWRTDKILRRLEAMLIVADGEKTFLISGNGEVIQPDDDIMAIGSGGSYAYAAAKALIDNTNLSAKAIAIKSMEIAAEICIYTNKNITVEVIK